MFESANLTIYSELFSILPTLACQEGIF